MASPIENLPEPRRNAFQLSSRPTPFNSELSPQSQYTFPTETFNSRRSSQRNKHSSILPSPTPPNLKRRASRFGLSSLFSKSKPLVSEEVQEKLGVHLECDESESTAMSANTAGLPEKDHRPIFPDIQPVPDNEPRSATLRDQDPKTALQTKSHPKVDVTTRSSNAWDPPPLFQAYPQAIRHTTLRAPTLSAENILRLNAERSSSSNKRVESYTPEAHAMKVARERKLKKPTTLDLLSKGDWTSKIFVLVTSGYLLQYTGQGSFDRLPEKVMPLSKESAAFASDAIPGKPYVLQISQIPDEDGTLDREASRSMFKSLGLRNQTKRSTSSCLLVFENPEDLSAWMAVVRKEIQAMGGTNHRPDEFRKPIEVESTLESNHGPSQRYLVQRDPNRFSQIPESPSNVTFSNYTLSPELSTHAVDSTDPGSIKRQSMATQQSVDSRTTSNAAESINQIHLDRLKESPRQSYASTAGKTTSTSRDSSPGPSPVIPHADIPQWAPNLNERRQTTLMYHGLVRNPVQQLTLANKVRRESTTIPTAPSPQSVSRYIPQQQRTPSPAAPNFSVPTFSKRYSSSSHPPTLPCATSRSQHLPTSLSHASPSPPVINEEEEGTARRASIIGELEHLGKPSSRVMNGLSPSTSTPPPSAGSCGRSSSSEGDRPFSRRFSSLEYSHGVSPMLLASQSPSPHPPPTTALPPIPGADVSSRTSFNKPPLSPLPPLPGTEESRASSRTLSPPMAMLASPSAASSPRSLMAPSLPETGPPQQDFLYPPPTKPLPGVPVVSPLSCASVLPTPPRTPSVESIAREPSHDSETPHPTSSTTMAPNPASLTRSPTTQGPSKPDLPRARDLHRPVSMQVRSRPLANNVTPSQTAFKTTFDLKNIPPPPTRALPSPPRPTRNPPLPPSEQPGPQPLPGKSSPRIGREPRQVSALTALPSPRSTISVISPATNSSEGAAPHPFIPPIKVSERKFRGSLDGPWNPAYGAPQRNFLDLGAT